jgi:hypothetical protein
MPVGASTPEELDRLFEDACLLGDADGAATLFQTHGVLVSVTRREEGRGRSAIAGLIDERHQRGDIWVAEPGVLVQAGRTSLLASTTGLSVARRTSAGHWRYVIAIQDLPTGGIPAPGDVAEVR